MLLSKVVGLSCKGVSLDVTGEVGGEQVGGGRELGREAGLVGVQLAVLSLVLILS